MSGIPTRGSPARHTYNTFYDRYDNQGLHIDTLAEGTVNNYQTFVNNTRPSDPLSILSGS